MKKTGKIILGCILGALVLGGAGVAIGVTSNNNLEGASYNTKDTEWFKQTINLQANTKSNKKFYNSNNTGYITNVEYKTYKEMGYVEISFDLSVPVSKTMEILFVFEDNSFQPLQYKTDSKTFNENTNHGKIKYTNSTVANKELRLAKVWIKK